MHKNKPALMRVLTAFVACVATAPSASAGLGDFLLPKHDVRVITMTDMTPAGASRPSVSLAHPSSYVAINGGYRDLGGIIGGDKVPPQDAAIKTIAEVLAKEGYLPASQENPPSLILVFTWGTLNPEFAYIDIDSDTFPEVPDERLALEGTRLKKVQVNQAQTLRFLLSDWRFRGSELQAITELVTESLFVASITAFDFEAAKYGEKLLLWKTKISCPSLGLRMDQALPTMLALAAPHIGRETMKPVSIKATDRYQPDIKIGEPEVVEYVAPLIVIDAPARDGRKSRERSRPEEGEPR